MEQDFAIQVENLGKMYTLYRSPRDRLKQILLGKFGKTFGAPFWALNEVSFSVRRGEAFGIIGKNGAGKSTLLQILAGLLSPTKGKVTVHGRVAALLELGSGFNPEFTGRENVILNGAILGIPRSEMEKRIDEIIEFADINEFIDQPVKHYSSGMFVRLAFSVATSVNADILLIDEALAVGDVFFRQKCYQKLETLREKGVSILLVSHSMNEVEQFCQRALLLNEGKILYLGLAINAVKQYYFVDQIEKLAKLKTAGGFAQTPASIDHETTLSNEQMEWPASNQFVELDNTSQISTDLAKCTRIAVCNPRGEACSVFQQGETARFYYEFILGEDIGVPSGGVELLNEKGTIVHGKNSLLFHSAAPRSVKKGTLVRFRQDIRLDIAVGEYSFNVGLVTIGFSDYEKRSEITNEELNAKTIVLCNIPGAGKILVTHRFKGEPSQLTHFGIANLPGNIWISTVSAESANATFDEAD